MPDGICRPLTALMANQGRVSVGHGTVIVMAERPDVPKDMVRRIGDVLSRFPSCSQERAWVGIRWRIGSSTVAHVFGGEDQLFRITFRAEPDEVMAFQHLGEPYFRPGWGTNVAGMVLDERTDWVELSELLTDSYCLQAPTSLADQVHRPDIPEVR